MLGVLIGLLFIGLPHQIATLRLASCLALPVDLWAARSRRPLLVHTAISLAQLSARYFSFSVGNSAANRLAADRASFPTGRLKCLVDSEEQEIASRNEPGGTRRIYRSTPID